MRMVRDRRTMRRAAVRTVTAVALFAYGLSGGGAAGASARPEPDLAKITVDTAPAGSLRALTSEADAVVYGWFDSADREMPTGRTVTSGRLVNFVQTFHAERYFKGEAQQLVRVLSTGIEPLPDALDPLNRVYPGPMIEGEYVCFLKRVKGSADVYTIAGGWQGVYPVNGGKTTALEHAGFKELDGLTLDQFARRVGGS